MGFFDRLNKAGEIDLTETKGDDPVVEPVENSDPIQETDPVEPDSVVEPQEPAPEVKPTEPQNPSSLTPEPQEPVPPMEPAPVEPEVVFDESKMYEVLSEKLGKEITSLEDLTPEPVQADVNPLEVDPQLKEIYEWRQRTGRPVSDWIKFQKDYDGMSDINIAREVLQYKYPNLTPEEVQLELSNFTPDEDDLDNDAIRKNLNLKKFATDGRRELNTLKSEFDTSVGLTPQVSEGQEEAINFYTSYKEQQVKNQSVVKQYNEDISTNITTFKSLPLKLSEELSIDYNLSDQSKGSLQKFMEMPHWYNEDGSYNHNAVVTDSVYLQNKDAIIKLAYEQGVAKGKEEVDKTSRNVTLDSRQTMETGVVDTDEIVVEGIENFSNPMGTKVRFGNK